MSTNVDDSIPKELKAPTCTREAELHAYDSLPKEIRQALQHVPVSISAISVWEVYTHFPEARPTLAQAVSNRAWEAVRDFPLGKDYPEIAPNFPASESSYVQARSAAKT